MKSPTKVAIYVRISSDPEGDRLGVQRQSDDCRKLAAERGWLVAEEYEDNDVSAWSGKQRPAYERMVADLRSGERDGLIVYNLDRLTRRPIELEQLIVMCESLDLRTVTTVTGDFDLGTRDGLFMARIRAANAAEESDKKSSRVKRKMQQNAEAGLPHGGPNRPFGFEDDKITHRPGEVAVIREMVARLLAGESKRSVAAHLSEQDVPTVTGKPWRSTTVTAIVTNPRIAGLKAVGKDHQIVGPAVWAEIITLARFEQLQGVLKSRAVRTRRAPRRFLLSGLLRCGRCEHTLFSNTRQEVRRYVCISGPDKRGCGGISIVAEPVEELIQDLVLFRLDSPALADALAGRAQEDERTRAASETLAADQAQLDELAVMWAAREITARDWKNARDPIEARINAAHRQIAQATRSTALTGWVGQGGALREAWSGLNLDRQAAIVSAVLAFGTVAPGRPGTRGVDLARVTPTWLL